MSETPKILEFPPSSTWREILLLLGIAIVLTAVSWVVRPNRPALRATASTYELDLKVPLISTHEALAAYDDPDSFHVFVDTRPGAMTLDHIPGAVVLRPDSFRVDIRVLIGDFDRGDDLILYGDGDLVIPAALSQRLTSREYRHVRILQGGYPAWLAAGGESSPPIRGAAP